MIAPSSPWPAHGRAPQLHNKRAGAGDCHHRLGRWWPYWLLALAILTTLVSAAPLWGGEVPAGWIRLLAGDQPEEVVLVDKSRQELLLLRLAADGLTTVARYPCATGQNHGDKREAGDERTPEGIYFITKTYTDTKITVFGRLAFHLDYPNFFDQRQHRNGDGIYIHGTNRDLTPNSTNGCISLRNEDLDILRRSLRRQQTPVVVVAELARLADGTSQLARVDEETVRDLILPEEMAQEKVQFLSLWCISDGRQLVAQGRYRLQRAPGAVQEGVVRGYLLAATDGVLLGERQWLPRTLTLQPLVARPKLPPELAPASVEEFEYPRDETEVRAFVERWRRAWESKALDDYIACYAPDFTQGTRDLAAWRRYKAGLNRRYRYIRVAIDDLAIRWNPSGAAVTFHQVYDSDRFHADGRKVLHLVYDHTGWRIAKEIWLD